MMAAFSGSSSLAMLGRYRWVAEVAPASGKLAAPTHEELRAHELHTCGAGKGLEVSPCRFLKNELVQGQLCHGFL